MCVLSFNSYFHVLDVLPAEAAAAVLGEQNSERLSDARYEKWVILSHESDVDSRF